MRSIYTKNTRKLAPGEVAGNVGDSEGTKSYVLYMDGLKTYRGVKGLGNMCAGRRDTHYGPQQEHARWHFDVQE